MVNEGRKRPIRDATTGMSDASSDPAEDSQRPRDPPPDAVMTQLDRILKSAEFAQSERLQKFLKFIACLSG